MKIGIIGNGFVGGALYNGFKDFAELKVFDTNPEKSTHTMEEVVQTSDYIFVCVPTPMNKSNNGRADLSIIESVLNAVSSNKGEGHNPIVAIKSSIPPGAGQKLVSKNSNLNIVFNPEFLTEKRADLDFLEADRIVIGGKQKNTSALSSVYKERFPDKNIIETDIQTAEFIKYMCNCFFATKVSFMNEMYQGAMALGVNWQDAVAGLITDTRVGRSHLMVPGPDGDFGFGGKCFPKDINAFINIFNDVGVNSSVLEAAWDKNLEVRNNHDWEDIPGAVSK